MLPRHRRSEFLVRLQPEHMFLVYFDHKTVVVSNFSQ